MPNDSRDTRDIAMTNQAAIRELQNDLNEIKANHLAEIKAEAKEQRELLHKIDMKISNADAVYRFAVWILGIGFAFIAWLGGGFVLDQIQQLLHRKP